MVIKGTGDRQLKIASKKAESALKCLLSRPAKVQTLWKMICDELSAHCRAQFEKIQCGREEVLIHFITSWSKVCGTQHKMKKMF